MIAAECVKLENLAIPGFEQSTPSLTPRATKCPPILAAALSFGRPRTLARHLGLLPDGGLPLGLLFELFLRGLGWGEGLFDRLEGLGGQEVVGRCLHEQAVAAGERGRNRSGWAEPVPLNKPRTCYNGGPKVEDSTPYSWSSAMAL
jgi:hypothetical protein